MKAEILTLLHQIETENNVQMLFAAESGSRAWGFASPDSDYDVRFIYRHPRERYLSVFEPPDTIQRTAQDGLLDVSAWDIRKTLQLLYKSNSSIFEWLQSPIVYHNSDDFGEKLWQIAQAYFSPRTVIHHFIGIATSTLKRDFDDGKATAVKIKKYFYVLRPVLSACWIVEYETPPPTVFNEMLPLLDAYPIVKEAVTQLLLQKETAKEGYKINRIAVLDTFIQEQMEMCRLAAEAMAKIQPSKDALDQFYKELLHIV